MNTMDKKKHTKTFLALLVLFSVVACQTNNHSANKTIIVCTTSIIGDGLKNICDTNFVVKSFTVKLFLIVAINKH